MNLKKFLTISVAAASLAIPMSGQSSLLSSYKSKCDSLGTLVQERTTVKAGIRLTSVMKRGNFIDFYFSGSLGDIPWTHEDVEWFKHTLHEITPEEFAKYKIGNIYCDRVLIGNLVVPGPRNDGRPSEHKYRIRDPKSSERPAMIRKEDRIVFDKGLTDRYIALWQSHGRYYEASTRRWEWQRAPLHTTVEDMYTQSYVLPFLIPMLENAGAYVMTPRERDTQKYEIITDNDPSFSNVRKGLVRRLGKYSETGAWKDAGVGFADYKEIYTGNDNPFVHGTARQIASSSEPGGNATITWTPDVPERGNYAVYISYKSLPNSSESAHYTVKHMGGTSSFLVNQRMGGGTWIYLGTFEFDHGTDGCVILDNGTQKDASHKCGSIVTADAVKIGGGMGKIARGNDDMPLSEYTTSGLPSFTEGALYWMQWAGIDSTITRAHDNDYTNDYADRGPWVSHMAGGSRVNPKEPGKGIPFDLAFAFHTDAGTTPADSTIGTLAIYTSKSNGSRKYPDGEDRMLGRIMTDDIQTQIVKDIRTQFEPEWSRRQLADRSYSESRTPCVPATLLELLSHQNFAEMKYGLDPSFRFTVSRAIYKGMLKFLSSRYGFHYAVQPLPVNSFSAILKGQKVKLAWKETPDTLEQTASPEGFILYTRMDDGSFDDGRIIKDFKKEKGGFSTEVSIHKGHIYSYKIVAYNEGGKSFPSEILSVGIAPDAAQNKTVLVVNNFDRVAPPAWFDTPSYAGFDDKLDRGVPYICEINRIGEMYQFRRDMPWTDDDNPGFGGSYTDEAGRIMQGNTFDYPYIHGKALLKAGYSFCSASAKAFETDSTNLRNFWTADIICGKQVTTPAGRGSMPDRFRVFPKGLVNAITAFASNGGNVLVSGANIGTDLWDKVYPTATDSTYQADAQAFAKNILGYKWLTNYASRCGQVGTMQNKKMDFSAISCPIAFYQQPNDYIYNVETPDGILPANNAASIFLRYTDTDISAGVCFDGKGYRSASLGFPIEVIKDDDARTELMKVILNYFNNTNK